MDQKTINATMTAAIAGLLHDIGKLEQRAREDPWNPAPGIEREGQPVHATWTIYFAQHHVSAPYRPAALAGAYHHNPQASPAADKFLSKVVALADKLSAGERADQPKGDTGKIEFPRQLISIFDRIQLDGQGKQNGWHYLPIEPLQLEQTSLFPGPKLDQDRVKQSYEKLVEMLRHAAQQPIDHPQAYLENLLGAMQRATWCVPSAYYHSIPDVSLYDHSRMTAALAACLAGQTEESIDQLLGAVSRDFHQKPEDGDEEILNRPAAYLVGGDISGIQDFIYTISSKQAARTLRGRSFYLQLLTEAVLRYTLRRLDLPYCNVIYSGGGHFYFLAPVEKEKQLLEIRKEITRKLLKHHRTSLYLALSTVPVPASGFHLGNFPGYWNDLHRKLGQAKLQRYLELEDQVHSQVFALSPTGGNPSDTCSVCGNDDRKVRKFDEREEQAKICRLCDSFSDQLGELLVKSNFLALGHVDVQSNQPNTAADVLEEFGLKIEFLANGQSPRNLAGAEWVTVWALDDPANDQWPASEQATAHNLRYTVNQVPRNTFDELQKQVEGGFERLGVLRMDVDNLGSIFSNGFRQTGSPDDLSSLARLSTLSFQMSLFFDGWVKQICREVSAKIYAVYSGGDDLFLIAPWDIVPVLAQRIHDDFKRYTGSNLALHISGGMSFMGGKYPLYQAARDAAGAESQAKDSGKNAFSFLDQAWSWTEFEALAARQKQMEIMHLQQGAPSDLLQHLRQFAKEEANQVKAVGSRPVFGPWMWISAYQLKRMAERYKTSKPDLYQSIEQIRTELERNNYQEIPQWGAAARWTQLTIRKKKDE